MTGIYLIIAELAEASEIQVRSGRKFNLKKGFYIYVGSALNSLEARLARHLGHRKKLFWHIDYLLNCARVRAVIMTETSRKEECFVARALAQRLPPVLAFGCSDCGCTSHLFFSPDLANIEKKGIDILNNLGLRPIRYEQLPSLKDMVKF